MTHLEIPDGVLAPWIWLGGYAGVFLLVAYFSFLIKKEKIIRQRKKLVHAGIISAIMALAMSVEIIAYHPNFTVISGIILGIPYSAFAALTVSVLLSIFGHGAFTTLGINTLIIFSQMALGATFFKLAERIFKNKMFWRFYATTFFALLVSVIFTVFIIIAGGGEKWGLHAEDFTKFAFIVSFFGITIESAISGVAGSYIQKIRPELLIDKKEV